MAGKRKQWQILAALVVQADNPQAIVNATATLRIVAVKQDGQLRSFRRNVKAGGASVPVVAVIVRRLTPAEL